MSYDIQTVHRVFLFLYFVSLMIATMSAETLAILFTTLLYDYIPYQHYNQCCDPGYDALSDDYADSPLAAKFLLD